MKLLNFKTVLTGLVLALIVEQSLILMSIRHKGPITVDVNLLSSRIQLFQQHTLELRMQHAWLSRCLDKCLEKLEAEKGLEPIPYDRFKETDYPRTKYYDPNAVKKYAQPHEPWFIPYKTVGKPYFDRFHDIKTQAILLNKQSIRVKLYLSSMNHRIENFEERLKRLEEHLNK